VGGFIDTDLPFEQARDAFRVDGWMQNTLLDAEFSHRLRELLAKRAAGQSTARKAAR